MMRTGLGDLDTASFDALVEALRVAERHRQIIVGNTCTLMNEAKSKQSTSALTLARYQADLDTHRRELGRIQSLQARMQAAQHGAAPAPQPVALLTAG